MSTETTFWYKRREVIPSKDHPEGKIIVECEDCINLYDVLRGFWKDDNTFVLQMKDAHEESRYPDLPQKVVDEMKRNNKLPPKERQWVLSYVELHAIDILRYRTATELMVTGDLDRLSKVQYPKVLNPPKPKAEVTITQIAEGETSTDQKAENPSEGMKVVRDEAKQEEELPSTLPKFETDPIDPPPSMIEEETTV